MIFLAQLLQHLLEQCPVQGQVSLKWTKKKTLLDIMEWSAGVLCPTSPSNNPPLVDCSVWALVRKDCPLLPGVRCPTSPSNNPPLVDCNGWASGWRGLRRGTPPAYAGLTLCRAL
ncbi:hypothetical protein CEXT_63591 [Caerostris extrusa]|uniref:Uncharacterized protein n=1 Tax=Caerostris extrusa TaxID=172846 RepID=A0AAV4MDV9_CAEEX|nr:hypothetical protein CEXT_63591 [Caerostris extrusa]